MPGARHTSFVLACHYDDIVVGIIGYWELVTTSVSDDFNAVVTHKHWRIKMMVVEEKETVIAEIGDNGAYRRFSHR